MLNRRDFLKLAGLTFGVISVSGCQQARGRTAGLSGSRPNIILIMADDMGFSDIGCYGGEINTPNIDRLAANGVKFTHFYNAARCCPTRASLMTGLYPHQAGMGGMVKTNSKPGPYQGYLNDKCVTIAEVLRSAGYTTLMSGKWHVGEQRPHWPVDRGFDRYFGLISGAANYWNITKGKRLGIKRQMALDNEPWTPPKDGFYMTDAFTDHAVEFLDKHGKGDEPFFMYLAYTAPHWPLHAWPEDIAKYKGKYMIGWDKLRAERHARQLKMGLLKEDWPLTPRDSQATEWDKVDQQKKEDMAYRMAVYAAQIDRMDQGIGRVLGKVQMLGKQDNTLVLFLSDNGGCHEGGPWGFDNLKNGNPPGVEDSYMSYGMSWANASNTPFRLYKHWVHEGGISTPLIAYWPDKIKLYGKLNHQAGHIIDIMATCCDVAGAEYPSQYKGKPIIPMQGTSLVPAFEGQAFNEHDVLFWEHEGNRAVRVGKWKLVSTKNNQWELYDIQADRTEMNNLVDKYPEKTAQLKAKFIAWAQKWGVNLGK